VDDPWTLSFLYNYLSRGVEIDTTFGNAGVDHGQNGVAHFGKLQAFVYGPVLDSFSWSRDAAHSTSTFLIAAAAVTWGLIVLRMTENRGLAIFTILVLPWMEPFFGAANQARPDALAFFLATLALGLFLYRQPFASGLAAAAALEVHPVGGAYALLFVTAAFAAQLPVTTEERPTLMRSLAYLSAGLACGMVLYVALHSGAISTLPGALMDGSTSTKVFLVEYFVNARYGRHLPELVIFLVAVILFFRLDGWREQRLLGCLLVAVAISLLLVRRPNFHYAIYPYVVLLITTLWVSERLGRLWLMLAVLLVLLVPQYAYAYRINRTSHLSAYLAAVKAAVPDDGIPIVGPPNSWYTLRNRSFYATPHDEDDFLRLELDEFYVVQDLNTETGIRTTWGADVRKQFDCELVSTVARSPYEVTVTRCTR
jgi:hypothetical protein